MDRSVSGGTTPASGNINPLSNPAINAKIEDTAQAAHQTVDKVADQATVQVDRLSGSAHRAVNTTASALGSAAEQASQVQTKLTEAACTSIRARPITYVAGALLVGYVFARLSGRRSY